MYIARTYMNMYVIYILHMYVCTYLQTYILHMYLCMYVDCSRHDKFEACSASIAMESHQTNWNPESDNGEKGE